LAVLCAFVATLKVASAEAATFVVDTVADAADADPGDGICATAFGCTLRAAIQEANASPGFDHIGFAIGSGAQTISPRSALPTIVDPVSIDGTTQAGFAGAPIIVVNGAAAGGNVTGLEISAGGSTLRGLVINEFGGNGVTLRGGGGNVVEGSYIGLDMDGTAAAGNGEDGLLIDGSPNNRVGGVSRAQRNLISGNTGKGNGGGIRISGGGGNVVQGNFIGTDVTGTLPRSNQGRGISIASSSDNLIGGADPGAGNLISANRATAIRMLGGSHRNIVQRNLIGTDSNGNRAGLGNDRGVQIRSGNDNQVLNNVIVGQRLDGVLIFESSANNLVQGNVIAHNGHGPIATPGEAGFFGVWVLQGSGNRVLSNWIFGNRSLGINLGADYAVTPNDPGDLDGGANDLQNFPTLGTASTAGGVTALNGSLSSAARATFTLQFFASPQCGASGHGEGLYPFGETQVTTDGAGNAAFSLRYDIALPAGWVVTATATGPSGTSEFSACRALQ
jgi:CSLREA domain-containing protein